MTDVQNPKSEQAGNTVPAAIMARFDAQWYLTHYVDLADAAKAGVLTSPIQHFVDYGFREGRLAFPFDPVWYLQTYPAAREDIERGLSASAQEHFALIGSKRGLKPLPEEPAPAPLEARLKFGSLIEGLGGALPRKHGRKPEAGQPAGVQRTPKGPHGLRKR